jgi:hypothetical protein
LSAVAGKRPSQEEIANCGDELKVGAKAAATSFGRAHALTFRIELRDVAELRLARGDQGIDGHGIQL